MKQRLVCLCLCLGVTPFAVGCTADANANDAKAKADPPKKTPPEFADLPPNDPLVTEAVRVRDDISRLEEDLLDRLDALRGVLASAKADPERMRQSVEQFLGLTKEMWQKTRHMTVALNALSDKTAELSRSSRYLATSYRALAELFRKKALDYREPKLRDQLNAFAADYDAVAASVPERCRALDAVGKKIPHLKLKVEELSDFLGDAAAFLTAHPGVAADPRERYADEFESFAVTFSEWLRVLDELRAALRERAVSKTIRDSHRKDTSTGPTPDGAKGQK